MVMMMPGVPWARYSWPAEHPGQGDRLVGPAALKVREETFGAPRWAKGPGAVP